MSIREYGEIDGLALAGLVSAGKVTPRELMESAISVAEARNPALNALCFPHYEQALDRAASAKPTGAFAALPFLLKDSGLASTLLPSSVGSRLFSGMRSPADSTLASRFGLAGFIPFARTTVPEFCMAPTTEAAEYGGPTCNPWDRTRSPGGSSGGAAVAVATGIVPIAHGSDGGGSIRIPASACGVFGLKPSRGLVPHGPFRGEGWGGLAVDGVLSRSVRDSAAALDAIAGADVGAPYAAPPRPPSYLALLGTPFTRPRRIAKWTRAFGDQPIAPECLEAIAHAERVLTDLGHEVIEAEPPALNYESFISSVIKVMAANVAVAVNGFLRQRPTEDWEQRLEPAILDAYRIGSRLDAEGYVLAINRFHAIGRTMEAYLDGYDFVLTPTLTQLPPKLGMLSMQDDFPSFRHKAAAYTAFLAIVNASGQPAASVPLHWTAAGLPVGVQFIGHFGGEADLLRLSAEIEAAEPWHGRRPPGSA